MSERQKYGLGCIVVILAILLLAAIDGLIGGNVRAAEPVRGWASTYSHTAGFEGQATVALPAKLGGRYDGSIYASVTVCADRCATFPAVDFCLCHVEPSSHPDRIVDLSHAAWQQVTDAPFGLIPVTVHVEPISGGVPDTALKGELLRDLPLWARLALLVFIIVVNIMIIVLILTARGQRR